MGQKIPTEINKFLGVNENESDTQLVLGEASICTNFDITDNYKLKKRDGYKELFTSIANKSIRGMWYGKISGSYHFLFACNGKLYEHNLTTHTNTEIGSIADSYTNMWVYGDKVYIQDGTNYKTWNSTTLADVEPYVPLIAINAPPAGGGTLFEELNVLTGKKHMTFSPDGTATVYQLPEKSIGSIDFVYVNGVLQTLTTDYTVNLTNGTVTTVLTLPSGTPGAVDIYWTKGTGQPDLIKKCKYAMFFGGENDTRVFMWGNPTAKNIRYYSGLQDPTYFPANNFSKIGSDEFAITDIVRQYDRQIIYTESEAYYSYYDNINGNVAFPVFPANSVKGNLAFGQARIILNNPYTIYDGVYEWVSSTVRDERNAVYKSQRVKPSLEEQDLTQAITCDFEEYSEYIIAIGQNVWLYNYRNDTWYRYRLHDYVTSFIVINKELYFGTTNGQIMRFSNEYRNDNGHVMDCNWEMGFFDWGQEWLTKYINRTWVSLQPDTKSSINVSWETNRDGSSVDAAPLRYNLLDYELLDYEDWSYNTSYNPQPFRLKTKAKKFVYFKLKISNSSLTDTAKVLSINFLARMGGESK